MAEILLVATCATIAWATVYFALPWMIRLGVLYCLHNVRDDMYDAADSFPKARDTRLYRDVEFLVTLAIHIVRERPFKESLGYVASLTFKRKTLAPEARAQAEAVKQAWSKDIESVFTSVTGQEALRTFLEAPQKAASLVFAHAVLANAMILVSFLFFLVAAVIRQPFRRQDQSRSDTSTASMKAPTEIATAVPHITSTAEQASVFATLRVLGRRFDEVGRLFRPHAFG